MGNELNDEELAAVKPMLLNKGDPSVSYAR